MANVLKWVFVLVAAFGSGVAGTKAADPKAATATQAMGGGLSILGAIPALLKSSPFGSNDKAE